MRGNRDDVVVGGVYYKWRDGGYLSGGGGSEEGGGVMVSWRVTVAERGGAEVSGVGVGSAEKDSGGAIDSLSGGFWGVGGGGWGWGLCLGDSSRAGATAWEGGELEEGSVLLS